MSSPAVLDFDALTAPISDESPAGISLKDDPQGAAQYYAIKDAREKARAAERAALHADEDDPLADIPGPPDWKAVIDLATNALTHQTKDLWIAAWLVEGLTRRYGFAGLRDGFELVAELCTRYWDGIHPRPDDDGISTTVAQLGGLNGEGAEGALIGAIAAIPITEATSVGMLTGLDYIDAEKIALMSDPESRARRIEQGGVTMEVFDVASRETSRQFYNELVDDIAEAMGAFSKMTQVLDAKCGNDESGFSLAPPSSQISEALSESLSRAKRLAGEPVAEGPSESDGEGGQLSAESGGKNFALGAVNAREDALKALLMVADYFRRTEPHSPVSYALEQAVRWGRMSLPDLIRELMPDDSSRREFCKRTGIKDEKDE